MQTWFDIAREKTSRTTTGVSGLIPEEIAKLFADFIAGKSKELGINEKVLSDRLRMAAEDLKSYYFEAVSSQPGQPTDVQSLSDWFWGKTFAAAVINEVRKCCLTHKSNDLLLAGKLLLVPRSQMYRFKES